jgi:hypothetical protein
MKELVRLISHVITDLHQPLSNLPYKLRVWKCLLSMKNYHSMKNDIYVNCIR